MFWLIGLGVVLWMMTKSPKTREEEMISPEEAEFLTEKACIRKKKWGQFPPMSTYKVGPVSNLQHRDGGGIYYDVAVELINPYDKTKYYVSKVMARGIEKGFVTLIESIGPINGREKPQEKTIQL